MTWASSTRPRSLIRRSTMTARSARAPAPDGRVKVAGIHQQEFQSGNGSALHPRRCGPHRFPVGLGLSPPDTLQGMLAGRLSPGRVFNLCAGCRSRGLSTSQSARPGPAALSINAWPDCCGAPPGRPVAERAVVAGRLAEILSGSSVPRPIQPTGSQASLHRSIESPLASEGVASLSKSPRFHVAPCAVGRQFTWPQNHQRQRPIVPGALKFFALHTSRSTVPDLSASSSRSAL